MKKLPHKAKIFLVFAAVVFGGYLAITLAGSFGGGVPEAFSKARMQGALIAQNIVDVSNKSATDLERISALDKSGNFTEALKEITAMVGRSQEIRNRAVELSTELEKMTRSLSEVKSFEARQAALEAIGNHLSMISKLINYSGYLGGLLEVLRNRFLGNFSDNARVADIISQINIEVKSINDLNAQAKSAIQRFDELVR